MSRCDLVNRAFTAGIEKKLRRSCTPKSSGCGHLLERALHSIEQFAPIGRWRFPAAAETQDTACDVRTHAHGGEHVRRFLFSTCTSGTGGNSEAKFVEFDNEALTAIRNFWQRDGNGVPKPLGGCAD